MTSFELISCLFLLSISAFLAASEIALFSLSRFQLRSLKESFRSGYWKVKKLLGDPGGLLITILVVNEVVNIALTAIVTSALSRARADLAGSHWWGWLGSPGWVLDTLLGIAVAAPLVLFFGEVTPKVFAARANQLVSTIAVGPLLVIYDLLKPVRLFLKRTVYTVARIGGGPAQKIQMGRVRLDEKGRPVGEQGAEGERILHEADFLLMLEEGHKEGAIRQSELELIKNVFEFDDTTVASVYTPLSQVTTLPLSTPVRAALQTLRGPRYSRVPVLSADRKQIVGVLHSKDMLRAKLEQSLLDRTVESLVRRPLFVHSTLRLNSLFRKFKQQRTHMAIVQDQEGVTLGVVTMSDVLDALFEDIFPDEEVG